MEYHFLKNFGIRLIAIDLIYLDLSFFLDQPRQDILTVHLICPPRPISNELIKRRVPNLINYNSEIGNKNLTANDQEDENIICSVIGCNDYANSNTTLTAGTRIFKLKICKNCKRKLELQNSLIL